MPSLLSAVARKPAAAVSRVVSKKASPVGALGARLDVVWEVGGFAGLNPGDSVHAVVATGPKSAQQDWKLVFYPRGFADPAFASFFVTNVGCLEERPLPPDTVVSASVSVAVAVAEDKKGRAGKQQRGGSDDPQQVCRKLSRSFSAHEHTFGFEKFADWGTLFGKGSPHLYDASAEGMLRLHVSINVSVAPPLAKPELEETLRDSGWQRVSWVLRDFKGLCENTPPHSKLSSPAFVVNGEWYLDIFPSGYHRSEPEDSACLSVYLHSTQRQAGRGDKIKRRLRLGMQRLNPLPPALYAALGEDAADNVFWAPHGDVPATFSAAHRSAGCQNLVEHAVLQKGRRISDKILSAHKVSAKDVAGELVAGKFDKGGSVTVILDILVNDQVDGQVRGGLLVRKLPPGAGVDFTVACHESKRVFSLPPVLGGAAGKPAHCCLCGHVFASTLLTAGTHTRLPHLGYERGRDVGELPSLPLCLRTAPMCTLKPS